MYGLSVRQWRQIFAILSRYGKRIDWVKLFGSRARGDYKPVSDVDLAIASTENLVTPLQLDFDQSQLPFTFDLIDYRRQPNQKLKDAIDREGKLLWAVDGKGEWMMTKEQLLLKWEDYHKALHRLEIALTKTLDEDDLYLDATIQRFEFTFELAWKLMKASWNTKVSKRPARAAASARPGNNTSSAMRKNGWTCRSNATSLPIPIMKRRPKTSTATSKKTTSSCCRTWTRKYVQGWIFDIKRACRTATGPFCIS